MWIGVISDTNGVLHPELEQVFEGMHLDWIVHCGSIGNMEVLESLSNFARVTGVVSTNDAPEDYPLEESLVRDFGGVTVLVRNDIGSPSRPNEAAMDLIGAEHPKIILFGGPAEPFNASVDGRLWFNPGPASPPPGAGDGQVGIIELTGNSARAEIITFPIKRE